MKIHQLPMGARFEYDGDEYVKTGPMVATGTAGQRMIPKYAVLKPLDGLLAASTIDRNGPLRRQAVLDAFGMFYARCAPLVPPDKQDDLVAARENFLNSL